METVAKFVLVSLITLVIVAMVRFAKESNEKTLKPVPVPQKKKVVKKVVKKQVRRGK